MNDKIISLPIFNLRTYECNRPGMYVGVERSIFINKDAKLCDEPKKVVELLQKAFDACNLIEEHVWLVCLDNALKVVGLFEIAHGTFNGAMVTPTNIYRRALFTNATKVIIAHNHTSGSVAPSSIDEAMTKSVVQAGKIIGIPLKDHIVIGKNGEFASMNERNPEIFGEEKNDEI